MLASIAVLIMLLPSPIAALPRGVTSQHISGWGDSITRSGGGGGCGYDIDWPCVLTEHTADDHGVNGEEVNEGTVLLNVELDADSIDADFVTLAWGTNDLQDAVYQAAAPECDDVDACFIDHLRTSAQKALDDGIIPILWIPPPYRISTPEWDDVGGCLNPPTCTLLVAEGGTRKYIRETLKPAILALAVELGSYDPAGARVALGRAVPVVNLYDRFVSLGDDMEDYYCVTYTCADGGIHPSGDDDPIGPNGLTGARIIAVEIETAINEWLSLPRRVVQPERGIGKLLGW